MVPMVNTKNNIIDSAVGIGAIGAFIGLYIGVILLISGAAILALKELSDLQYLILRKWDLNL